MEPSVLGEDGPGGVDAGTGAAPALLLRAPRPDDAESLRGLFADPDHQRWCPQLPPVDAGEARSLVERWGRQWAREEAFTFAIEVAGRCVGLVRLAPVTDAGARATWTLARDVRGRSLASGALRLALVWGFAQVGLQVVHWVAEVGNWPARRVAWACGFTVEGTVRDFAPGPDGTRRDAWVASLRWGDPLRPVQPWLTARPLAADGVRLGPHLPGDVDRIASACAAASTQEWLPALPSPYTVLDAAAFVAGREEHHAAGTAVSWAVRDPRGVLVGTVSLFHLGPGVRSAEIGYWAHPDARGRGLTTAAVRLVAAHALTPTSRGGLGLERLDLKAAAGNLASRRVAEKAGFTRVGTDRAGERLRDGRVEDFVRYDLLASEASAGAAGAP